MFQSTKQRRVAQIVFGVYLALLTWLVLFKFSTNLSQLPSVRSINWIPFYYDLETNTHRLEVFYNIIVFVPLGVYLHIFREKWKFTSKCLAVCCTSLLFELIQFVFAIGASDVTDLIGNSFGGLIGILFCMILCKLMPRKFVSLVNGLGAMIEIGLIGMLTLLLTVN